MKRLVMLILICCMIGIPINAVETTQTVGVIVASNRGETLLTGYLKREIDKMNGFKVAPDTRIAWKYADWQLRVTAVKLNNGLYAVATSVVKNRFMRSMLRESLTDEAKDAYVVIPESYNTLITTGHDLKDVCERIVVAAESDMRRW